jgi:hypothetical protein
MPDRIELGNACASFSDAEIQELISIADQYAEASGLVIKLASWAGDKAHGLVAKAPPDWQKRIEDATDLALRSSYAAAFATQPDSGSNAYLSKAFSWAQGERWHQVAAAVTGALGGLGGVASTMVDLPVTTTLILRSVQEIAAGYGEDISEEAVRVQCLAVFGFGGPLADDDAAETGLFASRMAFSGKALAETLKLILPRFGLLVTEKILAQATPLLGAAAGGIINSVFAGYYQSMAHVHFRLRKLESDHDHEQVKACFERIYRSRRDAVQKGRKGK